MMASLLNLGCGPVTPEGWVNVDASNRAWLAVRLPLIDRALVLLRLIPPTEFGRGVTYADLRKRFPWQDNSVAGIYMGEVLEHFTRQDGRKVLEECYRVLAPHGVLRVRVPDNARFWQNYLNEYHEAKQRPPGNGDLKHERWVEMFFRDICVRKPRRFRSMGHYHKWMYDDVSLVHLLTGVGFRDASRMEYLNSRLPGIEKVEVRDDLIVEAVK